MMGEPSWVRRLVAGLGVAVLVFLCLPVVIVVPMSFSSASSLEFPPPGLSLRWYEAFFGDPRWLEAAGTSLALAALASSFALLGTIAPTACARRFGRPLVELNFMAPLILPQIITGVALYIFFARIGLLGSFTGLVIGHTVLAVPYTVLVMTVAIRAFDRDIERAALSLGAAWPVMAWRVLVPNLMPSAAAAWIFAFIISFDEVIVTIFLAGAHETIPKRMFNELVLQVNPTITAIATLLIGISVVTVLAVTTLARRAGLLTKIAD